MRKFIAGLVVGLAFVVLHAYGAQVFQYIQFGGDLAGSTWNSQTLAAGSVSLSGTKVTGTLPTTKGGSGLSSQPSDDNLLISNGTVFQPKALPSCTDTGGNHLNYDTSTNALSCGTSSSGGGGGTPGGSNTQIQFNNSSAFGGDADFTWTSATNILALGSTANNPVITGIAVGAAVNGIPVTLQGGAGGSTSGQGANATVIGGSPGYVNGTGGDALVTGGLGGTMGTSGNVIINGGASTGGAGPGVIKLRTNGNDRLVIDSGGGWAVSGTPGTAGQTLISAGSGADPAWNTLGVIGGGTGLATIAQGDILYGSASNTISALAKSATATRYLANTGTTNNPAWAQVNLANGVTGTLPPANVSKKTVRVITAAGSVTGVSTDYFICVNKTTGAATTVNLHASPATGYEITVSDCKGDAATNNITVTPAAGNIDGAGTYVINANYGSWYGYYTGTVWKTIAVR